MKTAVTLFLLAACLNACSSDDGGTAATSCDGVPVAAGSEQRVLVHDGVDREYLITIPATYDGQTPSPLVLDLHGFTSSIEEQSILSHFPEFGSARGYIVVTPQGVAVEVPVGDMILEEPFWNLGVAGAEDLPGAADDVGFVAELIDSLERELCIDSNRVYVSGMSNGAGMAVALACELGGRFAAIAPVAGANLATCMPSPISVIAFHGDTDPLVPYQGDDILGADLGDTGVVDQLAGLAEAADCNDDPSIERPFADLEFRGWPDCAEGLDVELYTILGGGHVWPGLLLYADADDLTRLAERGARNLGDLDVTEIAGHLTLSVNATETILDFFDAHPRR